MTRKGDTQETLRRWSQGMDLNLKGGLQGVLGEKSTNRKAEVHKADMTRKGGTQEVFRSWI